MFVCVCVCRLCLLWLFCVCFCIVYACCAYQAYVVCLRMFFVWCCMICVYMCVYDFVRFWMISCDSVLYELVRLVVVWLCMDMLLYEFVCASMCLSVCFLKVVPTRFLYDCYCVCLMCLLYYANIGLHALHDCVCLCMMCMYICCMIVKVFVWFCIVWFLTKAHTK